MECLLMKWYVLHHFHNVEYCLVRKSVYVNIHPYYYSFKAFYFSRSDIVHICVLITSVARVSTCVRDQLVFAVNVTFDCLDASW